MLKTKKLLPKNAAANQVVVTMRVRLYVRHQ